MAEGQIEPVGGVEPRPQSQEEVARTTQLIHEQMDVLCRTLGVPRRIFGLGNDPSLPPGTPERGKSE